MDSGGQTLWNVLAMYAVCKIFYQMGKLPMVGVLQTSNIIRFQRETRRGSINMARNYSQASLWAVLYMREGGEAGKETYS